MTTQNMRASVASSRGMLAAVKYLVAILFALLVLIPLMATLLNGFKTNAEVLLHPVWCRPCMLRECPIDHRCMTGLRPERVCTSVLALMERVS